ncbi:putative histidine kinase group protein [Sordaria brevicollis]|uniref:histidine kinase n=1 Tax=Sordaria brevicollis TaxID=83679 RepID=A0AAE0NRB7_SORBR|nr:putative histidine kinase group protein [Sordaria brevicollis]
MRNVSERAREWETFRFLSTVRDHRVVPDPTHTTPSKSLRASSDTVLTALAQLGALQLSAQRGVLALFDHDLQHVAAEATPTLPLRPYARDDVNPLFLRGRDIPRSETICDDVIREQRRHPEDLIVFVIPDLLADQRFDHVQTLIGQEPYPRFYAGVPICSPSGIVIGLFSIFDTNPRQKLDDIAIDFLKDLSRTISRHLEAHRKQAVLLQTERILRGVVSYSEGKDDISSLSEYHAEKGSVEERRQDPWGTQPFGPHRTLHFPQCHDGLIAPQPHIRVSDSSIDGGTRSDDEYETNHSRKLSLPDDKTLNSQSITENTNSSEQQQQHEPQASETPTHGSPGADIRLSEIKRSFAKASNIIRESMNAAGVVFLDANTNPFHYWQDNDTNNNDSNNNNNNTASDVPTTATYSDSNTVNDVANDGIDLEVKPHKRPCDILGFSVTPAATLDGATAPIRPSGPLRSWRFLSESFLRKLLRRYPRGTIWEFDDKGNFICAPETVPTTSPPSSTNPSCPCSDSEIDVAAKRQRRDRMRRKDGTSMRKPRKSECDTIHAAFPEARAVSFFPLWGTQMQRWFAAGMAWTKEPLRIIAQQDELGLFNAFAKNVMAEVARIDATLANQAKSDMLGSISHEMLSPLHGILGAAELLLDTDLSTSQTELIHLVEACVRTLLDTVDHLLDHSKINSLVENTKLHNGRRASFHSDDLEHDQDPDFAGPPGSTSMRSGSLTTKPWPWEQPTLTRFYDVDLDVMLEEVVESLYAGYSFQRWCNQRGADPGDDNVTIHLDIDPTVNWSYYAQPGALRRILMNLFGNALKFTRKGFINLTLTAQPIPSQPRPSFASTTDLEDEAEDAGGIQADSNMKHSQSPPHTHADPDPYHGKGISRGHGLTTMEEQKRSNVILTVSDTGKGITPRFLREKAFSPFQKEDSLTPGPGLGLSIVKQIVDALGGRVIVDSRPGEGTTVRVITPLLHSNPEPSREERDIAEHREALKGLRVCLLGFDGVGDGVSKDEGGWEKPVDAHGREVLRGKIMERMCRDWLGCRVVTNPAEAQMTICSDRFVLGMCTDDGTGTNTTAGGRRFASRMLAGPLVVVCGNEVVAQNLSLARGEAAAGGKGEASVMEFIGQPVGPRKLAKTLRKCLQHQPVPLKGRVGEVGGQVENELLSRTSSESSIDLDVLQRKMSDPEVFQIVNKKSRFLPYLADDFRDNLFSTNKATATAATRPMMPRIKRTAGTPLVQQTSVGKDGNMEGGEIDTAWPTRDEEQEAKDAVTQEPTSRPNSQRERMSRPSLEEANLKTPVTRPPLPPRSRTGKEKANNMNFGFSTVSVSEISSPSPFDSVISPPVLTEVPVSPEDEQVSPMSQAITSILPSGPSNANASTLSNAGPTSAGAAGTVAAATNTNTGTVTVPDASPPPKPPELQPEALNAQRQQSILMTSPSITPSQPSELHVDTPHLTKSSTFPIASDSHPTHSRPSSPSNPHLPSTHPSQSLPNSPSQPRNSDDGRFSSNNNNQEKACLLVDDNPINLHILASAMRKTHRPFATARNGLEAVEIYKENPGRYKWVLMDISMPVMDGLEATRKIREFEREYPVQRSRSVGRNTSKVGEAQGQAQAQARARARARAGSLGAAASASVGHGLSVPAVPTGVKVGIDDGSGDGRRVIQRKVARPSLDGVVLGSTATTAPAPTPANGSADADADANVAPAAKEEVDDAKGSEATSVDGRSGTEMENNNIEDTEEVVKGLEPATVVALTGVTSGTIQKDALASGVDLFLTKPVRMKDLGAILGDG